VEDESWTWPEGKTFGQLTPEEKRKASRQAGHRLQAELTASAPAIARALDEADGTE
jgi:hypothetical protein